MRAATLGPLEVRPLHPGESSERLVKRFMRRYRDSGLREELLFRRAFRTRRERMVWKRGRRS